MKPRFKIEGKNKEANLIAISGDDQGDVNNRDSLFP